MKVKIEAKITLLEGEDAGEAFSVSSIEETETSYGSPLICRKVTDKIKLYASYLATERITFKWNFLHRVWKELADE